MLLILLLGCGEDDCAVARAAVGDDEPLGDLSFTVAEVLDQLVGPRALTATAADGAAVDVTFEVARGEGAAVLVDETRVSRLGADDLEALGQHGRDGPICQDEVQVPLLLTLTAEALGIAIAVEGQVVAPAIMPTDGSGVRVEASFPVDTATLPAPPADATAAFLVAMFPDEDPQELVLAWALEEGSERILVMTE